MPLPLELPEPVLPAELPLEPLLGELLGDEVVPPLVAPEPALEPLLSPLEPVPVVAPGAALEPDLLKCASHSEREIMPSLLVSTAEKDGAAVLVLPDAAGDDEDGLLVDGLLLLDDELCARATPDSANSAAAVAAVNSFRFNIG